MTLSDNDSTLMQYSYILIIHKRRSGFTFLLLETNPKEVRDDSYRMSSEGQRPRPHIFRFMRLGYVRLGLSVSSYTPHSIQFRSHIAVYFSSFNSLTIMNYSQLQHCFKSRYTVPLNKLRMHFSAPIVSILTMP